MHIRTTSTSDVLISVIPFQYFRFSIYDDRTFYQKMYQCMFFKDVGVERFKHRRHVRNERLLYAG